MSVCGEIAAWSSSRMKSRSRNSLRVSLYGNAAIANRGNDLVRGRTQADDVRDMQQIDADFERVLTEQVDAGDGRAFEPCIGRVCRNVGR
jgi:hypothetical protein